MFSLYQRNYAGELGQADPECTNRKW